MYTINSPPVNKKYDVIAIAVSNNINNNNNGSNNDSNNSSNIKYDNDDIDIGKNDESDTVNNTNLKNKLLEKLKKLGITGDMSEFLNENNENDENDNSDPLSYNNIIYELNKRQDLSLYVNYEKIYKVCTGINSLDIMSGKLRFNVRFSGLNFIDLFPDPQVIGSIQAVKDRCNVQRNIKIKRTL